MCARSDQVVRKGSFPHKIPALFGSFYMDEFEFKLPIPAQVKERKGKERRVINPYKMEVRSRCFRSNPGSALKFDLPKTLVHGI